MKGIGRGVKLRTRGRARPSGRSAQAAVRYFAESGYQTTHARMGSHGTPIEK